MQIFKKGGNMKKKIIIFLGIVIVLILGMGSHKLVAGNRMIERTYSHLESIGYTQDDIAKIEIKHSFLNKILSYNEWRIFVTFEKEPDVFFAFTYRDKQIVRQGIASHITQLDEEDIYEFDRKYDNGELKNH